MVCSICFESDHNKRNCPFQLKAPIGVDLSTVPLTRECDIPSNSEIKIAKELSLILDTKKASRKCSLCGERGHNMRTCPIKCKPCSDQVVRSYCFAGMSASMAIKMTRVLDCPSIYGETEEYL